MTDLELTVEALKRCVPKAAFEQAMAEVKKDALSEPRVDMAKRIHAALRKFGMPTNVIGYRFVVIAIHNAILDPSMERSINRRLYASVADVCNASPGQVERGIRRAIEATWDRGDCDALNEFFGQGIAQWRGKTTNSEFITGVAARLRLELGIGI